MRLHPVITVIGAEVQEFKKVTMPDIEINSHSTSPHTQLINSERAMTTNNGLTISATADGAR